MWYLDHMASKALPKFRKEKADAWAKDHLTIHLAGQLNSKEETVHYSIYPELITEQANIIILQIDKILQQLTEEMRTQATELVFLMDNHFTQKNVYVFSYLEYLAKTQRIPKTCMYFFLS